MNRTRTRWTAVFAKEPRPGRVKTRLCPPLTREEAARLAAAMLADTLERHAASAAYATELALAPAEAVGRFAAPAGLRGVVAQRGEGLGARLTSWFEARCDGASSAVVVGSDCPLLGVHTVRRAHELLEGGADAVFAPDAGGGYCLVGLRRPEPALFLDVPMSTPDMFARTLALARARGRTVALLPAERDVDTPADLEHLAGELARLAAAGARGDFPRHTHALLRSLLREPS